MFSLLKKLLESNSTMIGIDLGTTNTVVALLEGGEIKVLETADGKKLLPSVVAFQKDGTIVVGDAAYRQAAINPKTIYSVKRLMGRTFEEIKSFAFTVPYICRPGIDKIKATVEIDGKCIDPEQISAEILKKVKEMAEDYLKKSVKSCVITVPAYFNDRQRQATKDAGAIAGLEVKRIVNEPTAAAIAYGYHLKDKIDKAKTIAVYDLGGGTFDVSILRVNESEFEVLGTGGNNFLGGDDFDNILLTTALGEFYKTNSIDLSKIPEALQRLKEACTKAKIELSAVNESEIAIPFITQGPTGPIHLNHKFTRKEFENLITPLIKGSIANVEEAINSAKIKKSEIDEIVLVGGSTRIPLVQRLVKEFFNKEPLKHQGVDDLVAIGAAIYGAIDSGEIKDIEVTEITSLSLGTKAIGDIMEIIIPKGAKVPCEAKGDFTTVADNQVTAVVMVMEGEDRIASKNHKLGEMTVSGIEPRPKGQPRIYVTYSIDVDGVLKVSAVDDKGRAQDVSIKAQKLEKTEIKRVQKELELKPEERKQLSEAREILSTEIKRLEEEIKSTDDKQIETKLLAKVEEAEKVISEELKPKALIAASTEIQKVIDEITDK